MLCCESADEENEETRCEERGYKSCEADCECSSFVKFCAVIGKFP